MKNELQDIEKHDNLFNSNIFLLLWKGAIVARVYSLRKPNRKTWTACIWCWDSDGPLSHRPTLNRKNMAQGCNSHDPLFNLLRECGYEDEVNQYIADGRGGRLDEFFKDLGYEVFQVC